jgi:cysteine-rich repeat protein
MLSKHYRGGGGLAVLLGIVGSMSLSACGDSFTSCTETRTCRPRGGSPSDGGEPALEAGAGGVKSESGETSGGDTGHGDGDDGGQSPGGAGPVDGAEGGAPPAVIPEEMAEACSESGTLRCFGPAQKVSQICEAGKWATATICKSDENCDQTSGACAAILADCEGKIGGQLYCGPDDKVFVCGPDLVSTAESQQCTGKCTDSAASASCAPITCGDGKLQAPEACDDGNDDETDACTNACKKATCGDGSIWKDHEACDDGNDKNDDACSATCKVSTCGDGYVWAGKETCDDKNKVDTDACTNACKRAACGDGIVQAGKEECDDKNTTSGDGCSKTCTIDAPPPGAVAWYKATVEDFTLGTATLTDSNEFIKSYWVKSDLTAEAQQPDPDGGTTATALYDGNLSVETSLKHPIANSSLRALKSLRIRARRGERQYIWIGGPSSPSVGGSLAPYAIFDLLNGVVSSTYAVTSAKITAVDDVWYTCEVSMLSGAEFWMGVTNSSTVKNSSGPASAKPAIWIQRAEVEQRYVKSWHDRIGSRDFNDPNMGWRFLDPAEHFNGLPALESFYLSGSSLAAGSGSDWQFLHDGSGGTLVIWQRQLLLSPAYARSVGTQFDGAEQGMRLGISSTDKSLWGYGVSNASGEKVLSVLGGTTTGTRWLAASYSKADSPNGKLFEDGVMVASANASSSPSLSPSSGPLRLGDTANSPSQLVNEVVVYNRSLGMAEVEHLSRYFSSQVGTD